MPDMDEIRSDLGAEHAALDEIVSPLSVEEWETLTPAEGWAVRDQIAHLAFFDEKATEAVSDPGAFMAGLTEAAKDPDEYMNAPIRRGRELSPTELLTWWREARKAMLASFEPLEPADRIPWYGPPMSAASFATARLMETWAHGQDIADALEVRREASARLRHIAHLGVRTRQFSYTNRGLEAPADDIWISLEAPGGEVWTWGDEASADRVTGPAEDFCLIVTQRRHPDDTAIEAVGPSASQWISVAQAFAGPPGSGREAGS